MANKRDYYEVLGVGKSVSAADIKKAYRKLALRYHPDRNPGDPAAEQSFKEATEAYEILRDEEKRARYDQFGHAGVDPSLSASGFGGEAFGGFDLSDALRAFMRDFGGFGDLFGEEAAAAGTVGPARGTDLQIKLWLSLEEVAGGVEKKIRVKVLDRCRACRGSGAAPGNAPQICSTCGGAGRVRRQVGRSLFGHFLNITECPACRGEGRTISRPCSSCHSDGREKTTKTITVPIPAGVATGNYIPLRGQGNVGPRGGPPGDLIVLIEEEPHEVFERHGDEVLCTVHVSFDQIVLGTSVEVPTLDGRVKMNIPAGTSAGKIFRLRDKGIPHLRARGRGDQLVRIHIWIPKKLKKEERRFLEQMKNEEFFRPPPR